MNKIVIRSLVEIAVILLIGAGVAFAGSQNGAMAFGMPLFTLLVILAFAIQAIVFVPSFINQTEHFFDLTGSLTYITLAILAVVLSPEMDPRSLMLMTLILIWAGRLGAFLFMRVRRSGKDGRFDELKVSFWRFFSVWMIQGLWVTFTAAAAFAAMTSANPRPLGAFAIIGLVVWMIGFGVEVVADKQKTRFRADEANKGRFITAGLWSISRHPNYLGEIILWIGVAIIAFPVLQGWQCVTMISPIFVIVLLSMVSGVPLLERRADEKWGGQADYEAYKEKTAVLIPGIW